MARRVFSTIGNVGVRLVAKPTPSLSKPAKIVNHFSDRKFTPEAGEEERAIIRLFVRETEVRSVKATINYTIPTPEECPLGDGDAEEVVPDGEVMNIGVVGGLTCPVLRTFRWEVTL